MKTSLFIFSLITILSLNSEADAQNFSQSHCPQKVEIIIQCPQDNSKDFQLMEHIGQYSNPKTEYDETYQKVICTYGAQNWNSVYKTPAGALENVSNLAGLVKIVEVVQSKGFNTKYFKDLTGPFSTVTFKKVAEGIAPDNMFLFSGIESTFGNQNFTVAAATKISTVVLNDEYYRTKNNATDALVTGSSCVISIK